MTERRDPVADLRRIAFLLERAGEATYRVRAFRRAADLLAGMDAAEVARHTRNGTLRTLPGVGEVTARCVTESLAGEEPVYLRRLTATAGTSVAEAGDALRARLRGDCHTHSTWSDGGSPIVEMAATAMALGHEYLVVTDHSPRLTVANGLSAERLARQLDEIATINDNLPRLAPPGTATPLRLLTGIEVDILADGSLDQTDAMLSRLDLVVASIHSGLRDPADTMTRRMLAAIDQPHVDVLGHCTGRLVTGRKATGQKRRPESTFDAEAVFAACADRGVAVEINSRPERLDPPKRLLRLAVEAGCLFAINSDAHAPGQLDWLPYGCARAAACGVDPDRVVNTWPLDKLLAWTHRNR